MTRPLVGVVHGLNATDPDKARLAIECERALDDVGIDSDIEMLDWHSTGTLVGDLFMMTCSDKWIVRQVSLVALRIHAARLDAKKQGRPFIVVAHSAGCAMSITALHTIGVRDVPIVCMAPPHMHPLWGPYLDRRRLESSAPSIFSAAIYNAEDIVASALERYGRTMGYGWIEERISLAGRRGVAGEHDAVSYLEHPRTISLVVEAIIRAR